MTPSADDTRREGSAFRRLYGASPWHLLSQLGCFALAAYAVSRVLDDLPVVLRIGIWFVGAAVLWDLVIGPGLALVDRLLRPLARLRVPALNYVRVPLLVSLLLLVVWAPLILQRSEFVYGLKTGLLQDPYPGNWLAVAAALFALSGVAYLVALLRSRSRSGR